MGVSSRIRFFRSRNYLSFFPGGWNNTSKDRSIKDMGEDGIDDIKKGKIILRLIPPLLAAFEVLLLATFEGFNSTLNITTLSELYNFLPYILSPERVIYPEMKIWISIGQRYK